MRRAAFLLWSGCMSISGHAESIPRVEVLVINKAAVAAGVLSRAEEHAGSVLQSAGVGTRWIHCGVSLTEPAECAAPFAPHRLMLQLLPPELAPSLRYGTVFGFALPLPNDGGFRYRAGVLWWKVQGLAADSHIDSAVLLGRIMAHEIGHLLLDTPNHAVFGIMKANWGRAEMERLGQGGMLFLPTQAGRIRQGAIIRMRANAAQKAVPLTATAAPEYFRRDGSPE